MVSNRPVQTFRRPGAGPVLRWLRAAALTAVGLLLLCLLAGSGLYFYYSRGLPSVEALRDYRPPQVTKVFCATPSSPPRTRTSTGTRGWTTWACCAPA